MARSRRYARGARAWGHDQRTGDRVLRSQLVRDGDTGLLVTRESYEPKHPQETPPDVFDPQVLRKPAPDLDKANIGYTVQWPTATMDATALNAKGLSGFIEMPRIHFYFYAQYKWNGSSFDFG